MFTSYTTNVCINLNKYFLLLLSSIDWLASITKPTSNTKPILFFMRFSFAEKRSFEMLNLHVTNYVMNNVIV